MPIMIASGPVIVEQGKVLLNKHGDTPFWKFCGGRIYDLSENLAKAAQRKAKEEMGIEIEILDPIPFLFYTQKTTETGLIEVILVHFLAKRLTDVHPGSDIREWTWLPTNDLPDDLGPNILPALKHFECIS